MNQEPDGKLVEIQLGRFKFRVPVIRNEEMTHLIAQEVSSRIEQIEKNVPSAVSTVDCSLLTAFALAAELKEIEGRLADLQRDVEARETRSNRELMDALDVIQTSLEELIEKHS